MVRKDGRYGYISVLNVERRYIGTPTFYQLISASRSALSWIFPSLLQPAPFGSSPGTPGSHLITISNASSKLPFGGSKARVRDETSTDWRLPMREDSLRDRRA